MYSLNLILVPTDFRMTMDASVQANLDASVVLASWRWRHFSPAIISLQLISVGILPSNIILKFQGIALDTPVLHKCIKYLLKSSKLVAITTTCGNKCLRLIMVNYVFKK